MANRRAERETLHIRPTVRLHQVTVGMEQWRDGRAELIIIKSVPVILWY